MFFNIKKFQISNLNIYVNISLNKLIIIYINKQKIINNNQKQIDKIEK